ncbi:hypothetical protein [Alicyclobacillus suci]|uniref:hypothetical protein n=1 Tax=Alicyclobacillus suci TaxID=2816080 RepID=UPI001A90B61D|nr:hypothetical protein [Alicyclobacillus suci]
MLKLSEQVLVESPTARTSLLNQTDVLDRVKKLSTLPGDIYVSLEMAASYYEVSKQTIASLIHDHRGEFENSGLRVLQGEELNSLKEFSCIGKRARSLTVLPRRAVLLVGMFLRDSEVARQVRTYLLDKESVETTEPDTRTAILRWVAANTKVISDIVLDPRERIRFMERIYSFAGIPHVEERSTRQSSTIQSPVLAIVEKTQQRLGRWYACHDIAERYGLYSINHRLHIQLVSAIIQTFGELQSEVDVKPVLVTTNSSKKAEVISFMYSERIAKRVGKEMERLNWPDLVSIKGTRFKVMYRNKPDNGRVATLA